ncbi:MULTISPECIES: arsenate reductase ArsC [unclassified Duganella]|uniref:arsenate reductase ArsC n=1 Tax=unclassified Duganella TaxID=2636909 RepID=UPI0006F59738|nr:MULTISPECIES: arsenate reductase ArsC [unclassified Duganella]KQV61439.1 arsenate reductase [Duganella sp. Root336D2]KRB92469.1 arsenate reductase [Duganella sp. Root198D2]
MSNRTYNVLFLSTQNTARSIMAEAMLNAVGGGRFRAFSAGSQPAGKLNLFAVEQIRALDDSLNGLRSKSLDEFSEPGAPEMDFVITMCDVAAGEPCPVWPGQPASANWNFRDPAARQGPVDGIRQEFFTVCREIKTRLEIFRNLPAEALDEMALQRKIARIAGVQL